MHITFELNREGKPRTEIVVEQIRALTQRLSMTSQFGGWQMALIDPADAMNAAAANALLKTLEEPTAASMLVLVADASWRLPATIRSRCQCITLQCPPQRQAQAWLRSQNVSDALVDEALAAAGGNPGLALELAGEGALPRHAEVVRDLAALRAGTGDAHAVAQRWAGDEPRQRLWFAARDLHQRSVVAAKSGGRDALADGGAWFSRTNRARELLRGPLRAELVLLDVLASLAPPRRRR